MKKGCWRMSTERSRRWNHLKDMHQHQGRIICWTDTKKSISFIMECLRTALNKYHGSRGRGRRETQHEQQWTWKRGLISVISLGLREREDFEQDSVYILKPLFVFFLRLLLPVLKMIIYTFLITFALSHLSDTLDISLFWNQVQDFEPKEKNM